MRSLGRSCGSSKTSPTSNRPELPKTFPRERSQLPLRSFEGPMCNGQFPRGATRDGFTMIELVIGIVGVGLARLIAVPFTAYRDLAKPARLVDFPIRLRPDFLETCAARTVNATLVR